MVLLDENLSIYGDTGKNGIFFNVDLAVLQGSETNEIKLIAETGKPFSMNPRKVSTFTQRRSITPSSHIWQRWGCILLRLWWLHIALSARRHWNCREILIHLCPSARCIFVICTCLKMAVRSEQALANERQKVQMSQNRWFHKLSEGWLLWCTKVTAGRELVQGRQFWRHYETEVRMRQIRFSEAVSDYEDQKLTQETLYRRKKYRMRGRLGVFWKRIHGHWLSCGKC